jgi:hypothetical protein
VRKEWFIVSHTNSKTKKVLIGLLNQTNQPIAIVNGQQGKGFSKQPNASMGGS